MLFYFYRKIPNGEFKANYYRIKLHNIKQFNFKMEKQNRLSLINYVAEIHKTQ